MAKVGVYSTVPCRELSSHIIRRAYQSRFRERTTKYHELSKGNWASFLAHPSTTALLAIDHNSGARWPTRLASRLVSMAEHCDLLELVAHYALFGRLMDIALVRRCHLFSSTRTFLGHSANRIAACWRFHVSIKRDAKSYRREGVSND